MLIILEGADGSGKTTLRQKFSELGYMTKACIPHETIEWEVIRSTSNQIDVVLDRSVISDMVYRTVLRDEERWDISLREAVRLFSENTIVIHCKTNSQYEDSMQRGEDNITDKAIARKIDAFYDDFLHFLTVFTDIKLIKYNWQKDSFDELLKAIKKLHGGLLYGI